MRITVPETSPNAPDSIIKDLYIRVGGGFAPANSMIQWCFDAIWCIWICLQHNNSH